MWELIKATQREQSCADWCSEDAVSKRPPYPHRDYGEKLRLTTKTAVHSLVELSPLDPLHYSRNEITTGYFKGDLLNGAYAWTTQCFCKICQLKQLTLHVRQLIMHHKSSITLCLSSEIWIWKGIFVSFRFLHRVFHSMHPLSWLTEVKVKLSIHRLVTKKCQCFKYKYFLACDNTENVLNFELHISVCLFFFLYFFSRSYFEFAASLLEEHDFFKSITDWRWDFGLQCDSDTRRRNFHW